MVRIDSAIKERAKPSFQADPNDIFEDFPYFINDSFPDFDSIEDWIIEQDTVLMPTDGRLAEDDAVCSDATLLEEDERRLVLPFKGNVKPEVLLESELEINGQHGNVVGSGSCTDLLIGESHRGVGLQTPGLGEPGVRNLFEEESREEAGFPGVSSLIVEEMEKVCLLGACESTLLDSASKLEEPSKLLEARSSVQDSVNAASEAKRDDNGPGEGGNANSERKYNDANKGNNTVEGKLKRDSDASDSDSSESETEEESSSSSSSEVTDDDEEEEEEEAEEDAELEEGQISDRLKEETVIDYDDEEEAVTQGPIKSRNELEILPPVPPVNAVLEPRHQTIPVGVILSILGTRVIVEGREKHSPLNEGSILWITDSRLPLGLVDEIFGPVRNPYYVIRYNSENEVPTGVQEGLPISFVVEFANHVLNDESLYKKGYDASGENDEEMFDEAEFSDDEKEAEYRRMQRSGKRGKAENKQGNQETEKRGKAEKKHGNQETEGRKGIQAKDERRQDFQPIERLTPAAVDIPETAGATQQVSVPGPFQMQPGPNVFGFGNFGCASVPQSVGSFGGALPAFQFNGMWPNMVPTLQHLAGPLGNAISFPGLPFPQQHNHLHHQNQHPNHMFGGFQSGIPFQPLVVPNQNGILPFGTVNLSAGSPSLSWPGPLAPGNVSQEFGTGLSGQLQPQVLQGGLSSQQQFNSGGASGQGRRPFQRGRGRGRGGRFSGGRGQK